MVDDLNVAHYLIMTLIVGWRIYIADKMWISDKSIIVLDMY